MKYCRYCSYCILGDCYYECDCAKQEAIKEFAERLCENRVSNDAVVIAAKCLVKEMVGEGEWNFTGIYLRMVSVAV